jgi:hypothetical protein
MANPPTSPKGTGSSPSANGKTAKQTGRAGPYDPKPGAAVKGKSRAGAAAVTTAGEQQARRAERRPDLIKKRREDLRRLPEKRQREKLITRLILGGAAVLLVAAIAFSINQWANDRDLNQIPDGTVAYTEAVWTDRGHDDSYAGWPDLDKHPPVGGIHSPTAQNCGFYPAPVGNSNAIHSLEHGAVWITYLPTLPQDQIDKLQQMAEEQSYILVSPYATQTSPVVATAWDHQLFLQSADDKDLDRFIRVFKNNRQYTPEYGAACSGTDTTM